MIMHDPEGFGDEAVVAHFNFSFLIRPAVDR
jgi:hypothetical protein